MASLTAHVRNGRIVVDEPADLPEGTEVEVALVDGASDDMPPAERAALLASIREGCAQADRGEGVEASEFLAELDRDFPPA
jgi:hypothetical protein